MKNATKTRYFFLIFIKKFDKIDILKNATKVAYFNE